MKRKKNNNEELKEKLDDFLYFTKHIVNELDSLKKELLKATRGNQAAAQRSRVALIELEKSGRLFRKFSREHMPRVKEYVLDSN